MGRPTHPDHSLGRAVEGGTLVPANRPGRPGTIRGEASRRGVSESTIRKERAAAQGRSAAQGRGHPLKGELLLSEVRTPSRPSQLLAASPDTVDMRSREAEALGWLRRDPSRTVSGAEREFGLPRRSLRRDMPTAFDQRGKLKATDREAVAIRVIGPDGDQVVVSRSSRSRQLAGQHRQAVRAMLRGDLPEGELRRRFRGKSVGGVELETDPDRLRALYVLGGVTAGPYPEARR